MIGIIQEKEIKTTQKRYTIKEYFELEEKSLHKNEFTNGKINPMAGDTINNGNISGTIYFLLMTLFFNSDEEVEIYSNDQRVYIEEYNKFTYTDTFAIVGKTEAYQYSKHAVLNPTLIVEVASKSTERYDRTTKFRMYKSLASFKEYVIVNQDMPIVEVFLKIDEKK